ncbi:O-antigen ligase family protein [Flavobacterium ponti]|uniref:O-antigen ligase family protein n=1 Tax=Flavobacterium ponti TaxID=665133 RepID=A0ABV9P2N1_9FLAO
MLSQILGIAVVGTYYYNFVRINDVNNLIKTYVNIALFIAIIGFPLYFLGINFNTYNDPRFYSILKEPAHYVILVLPACYYYFKTKKYISFFIIFITLIISNSSLGYIGCGLIFILPNLNRKRLIYLSATVPFVIISFIYTYNNFEFFKLRVDDTVENLKVIKTGKFKEDTNLSSYVMLANIYIMKENIKEHPFGSGIGSHHYMHTKKYLKTMRPPQYLRSQKRHTDNSFDANSLFNRMLSEFGVIGLIFIIISFILFYNCFTSSDYIFSQGLVIYFILKLFRDGHYFPPELFFFIWIFYFSFIKSKSNLNA